MTEYNVLLIGPTGCGKTSLISKKMLGPTISKKIIILELEKHLVKLNDMHGLNFYDTPGIMNLYR